MQTQTELKQDIDSTDVELNSVAFWWLGQHSFVVKTNSKVIYFDPYLSVSQKRLTPPALNEADITNADIVFCSHNHSDHVDPTALNGIAKNSNSFFVGPTSVVKVYDELNIKENRIYKTNCNEPLTIDNIKITSIPSAHEMFDYDKTTGYPYVGFIVEVDGVCIYHSGDTCKYEGLETRLKEFNIDVAFLPINGRSAERLKRKCYGNMTYQEAVDLAGAITPRLTIPAHYGMFANNTEDPKLFTDYMDIKFPNLAYAKCEVGEKIILTA